jgi:division protein CdvB (Snf7/Vps24/ESCRT-III family)
MQSRATWWAQTVPVLCDSANLVQNACKILAKDLVRTRRYMQKFTQMRVQLQAVSLRMQTLRSNEQMASAMKGATRVGLLGETGS